MKGPEGEVIRPSVHRPSRPVPNCARTRKTATACRITLNWIALLDILVDQDGSIADCVAAGFSGDVARKVERLIYLSEYKRFQSAPGARLTKRAFWLDRRYPIVNRWRDPS